jgi:drug/metabolite transporter (DMT)-like permease
MKKTKSPLFPAYLALIAGIFIIGTSAILVKFADVSGLVSGFYRLGFATLVLLPIWLHQNRSKRLPIWDHLKFILLGGFLFGIDIGVWNTSILMTTAAKATLFSNNAPIWVGLGAAILFKEKLTPKYWSGLAVALLGMSIIVGVDSWRTSEFNLGDMIAIASSILYASVMLTTQKARTQVDTLTFSALYTATAALTLLPAALLTGQEMSGFSSQTWWALLGLGLGPQVVGWLLINYALGHLRASHVSVSLLGQPVVTAILGVVILGEALTSNQMIGGALVLTGIYLVNQKTAHKGKQT